MILLLKTEAKRERDREKKKNIGKYPCITVPS